MKDGILAKRYAKAFQNCFDSNDVVTGLTELLSVIEAITSQPDLITLIQNPLVQLSVKEALLKKTVLQQDTDKRIAQLLLLLVKKNRCGLLQSIQLTVREQLLEHQGVVEATVSTNDGFSQQDEQQLEQYLSSVTNKKVVLGINKSNDMLGGFKATVGHVVYDGTVENAFEKLRLSFN